MSQILVIDDDKEILKMASDILDEAGHATRCVTDIRVGIHYIIKTTFDVIITNVSMPAIDGFNAVAVIRALDHKMNIIAMIAADDDMQIQRLTEALEDGACRMLDKPFTKTELVEVVEWVLAKTPKAA